MTELDLVVVGAGFGGIASVHEAVAAGLSVRCLEGGSGAGGVWFWNRYPGARCDTESLDYSFSFSPELDQDWTWSERYPTQPELEKYLNHVVDRFGLREHFTFDTLVTALDWEADRQRWRITSSTGVLHARNVALATGMLHERLLPRFPGMDDFGGLSFHSAAWPDGLDLTGQRVAVVGTGSSGIQIVPAIADTVAELHVFQRTANYLVPAQQGPIDPEEYAEVKRTYPERRRVARHTNGGLFLAGTGRSALDDTPEQRRAAYDAAWGRGGFHFLVTYTDLLRDEAANDTASAYLAERIAAQVADPDLRARLIPGPDVRAGVKRIGVDVGFYAAFERDHVHLVDATAEPIEEITATGIRTSAGHREVDVIVYATGFDAFTGSINAVDVRGTDGRLLREEWADGPATWHGLMVAGYPNLFLVCGPGSSNIASNVPALNELTARWVADVITTTQTAGVRAVDPDAEVQRAYTAQVQADALTTLVGRSDTWFTGRNVAGKARVYPTWTRGSASYFDLVQGLADDGYAGLHRLPIPDEGEPA